MEKNTQKKFIKKCLIVSKSYGFIDGIKDLKVIDIEDINNSIIKKQDKCL